MPDTKPVMPWKELADKAYCDYVKQLNRTECLGVEAKLKNGEFGISELKAHCKASELLGRHRAFAEISAQSTSPSLPPEVKALVEAAERLASVSTCIPVDRSVDYSKDICLEAIESVEVMRTALQAMKEKIK